MWTLRYDPRVRKQLGRIRNKNVIRRIKQSAESLRDNPHSGKLLRGYSGVRSKRIGTPEGEYRLIYRLLEKGQEAFVILIGPREEIYEILRRQQD